MQGRYARARTPHAPREGTVTRSVTSTKWPWLGCALVIGLAAMTAIGAEPAAETGATAAEKLIQDQQAVTRQFRNLEGMLVKLRDFDKRTDRRRAVLMEKALHECGQRQISPGLQEIVPYLKKNQLSAAVKGQHQAAQDIAAVVKLLKSEKYGGAADLRKERCQYYAAELKKLTGARQGGENGTAGTVKPAKPADDQAGPPEVKDLEDLCERLRDLEKRTKTVKGLQDLIDTQKASGGGTKDCQPKDLEK